MSLDITLEGKTQKIVCFCNRCANQHEREEVEEFFEANITHNLAAMAREADICDIVWSPEENDITKASQLIEPLEKGIALMRSDPDRFKKHNPSNGWGKYEGFVEWLERYLSACKEYPDATVKASR